MKRGFDINIISKYRQEIYGIATIWVILSHVADYNMINFDIFGSLSDQIFEILYRGNLTVDIFLFLSGISLYYAWQKNSDLEHFYLARVKRILPTYMMLMILAGLVHIIFHVGPDPKPYLLTLSGMRIFIDGGRIAPWYATCIAVFYLIFPALYIFIYGKHTKHHFIRFMVAVLLWYAYIYNTYKLNPATYENVEIIMYRLPVFITGIFFGKYVKSGVKLSNLMWPACIIVFAIGYYLRREWLAEWFFRLPLIVEAIPLTYLFAGLMKLIDKAKNVVAQGFLKGLRKIGGVSFEVYVAHVMIIRLFVEDDGPFNIIYLLIGLVATFVLAFGSRHLAEKITSRGFSKKAIKEAN